MTKYKVGDKVRALVDERDITKGAEYVISVVDTNDDVCPIMVENNEGYNWWLNDDEFELITTTPDNNQYTRILEKCAGPDAVSMAKAIYEIMLDSDK